MRVYQKENNYKIEVKRETLVFLLYLNVADDVSWARHPRATYILGKYDFVIGLERVAIQIINWIMVYR